MQARPVLHRPVDHCLGLLVDQGGVSELDVIVGEDGLTRIANSRDAGAWKVRYDPPVGLPMQMNQGERACVVDVREQVELTFCCAGLRDVDVEIADR